MQNKDYEIVDFHTHPFLGDYDNICAHKPHCDMSTENIIRDLKAVGITKICGSNIVRVSNLKSESNPEPTQWDAVKACNDGALKLRESLGDFYIPGIMVHPDYVRESCEEIERACSLGVRLIGELVPYMHGWNDYSCNGFGELLELAADKDMIVSIHSMGEENMDKMLANHPRTKIVFAHPGEYGEVTRHIKRMKGRENCWLDLSGYGIFRHGMLRAAINELGVEKLIFGSDYPTCNPAMYVGGVLLDPLISDSEKEAIFAGNARSLFASCGLAI